MKVIFDLEATCEEKGKNFDNETIEIGAVKVWNGEIIDEFQAFIRPLINPELTDFCKNLTKITQEDVDNADTFDVVIERFKEWVDGAELLSWGFYDRKQLEKDSRRFGIDVEWLKNHRSLKHEYQELRNLERPIGVKGALKNEGLAFEGTHHRGIDDARNIAKLYLKVFDE